MRHILVSIVFLFVFLFAFIGSVSAIVFPDFGSCLNPRIAASQVNSGTNHGVVGSSTAYSGTDSIYRLSDGNVLQCLCQDNGDGIQTIWFRASSMTQEDSAYLLANGWIYVPTGSAWGLNEDPYFAKNSSYSCKGSNNSSSSSSSSNSNGTSTTTGSILGLATTGNAVLMYGLIFAGLLSLFAGLFLKKVTK